MEGGEKFVSALIEDHFRYLILACDFAAAVSMGSCCAIVYSIRRILHACLDWLAKNINTMSGS